MKFSKEAKIAVLAIVAGIILYFGVRFLKGIDFFSPVNEYYVIYNEIEGLSVSNPITISGYPVGRVSAIRILQEKNNKILVSFDIDKDLILGKDATAVLRSSDLLGNKVIALEVGDLANPMSPGDTLNADLSQDITSELKATALPLADSIKSTISIVNTALVDFGSTKMRLDSILSGIVMLIDKNQRDISGITRNLNAITTTLADEETGLKPLLAKFDKVADSLSTLQLANTLAQTNATLKTLQDTFDKIKEGEGTMGKLANDDSLYNNLSRSAEDLDRLLIDLRENPKRYVHFSLFGGKDKIEDEE